VGFTEPPQSPAALVVSYTTVSPLPRRCRRGGLFSVALSRGSPRVGVTDHPALWSPVRKLPGPCAKQDRRSESRLLREPAVKRQVYPTRVEGSGVFLLLNRQTDLEAVVDDRSQLL